MKFKLPKPPICKFHLRAMKLMDADVPTFRVTLHKNTHHVARKIYRCPLWPACPCVENGPSGVVETMTHGGHEVKDGWLLFTNPF